MPPARPTRHAPTTPPLGAETWNGRAVDGAGEAAWPAGMRALLLITGAVSPDDSALARVSNDELALLRASMSMLSSGERTSAA